jgi:hypothetical protein
MVGFNLEFDLGQKSPVSLGRSIFDAPVPKRFALLKDFRLSLISRLVAFTNYLIFDLPAPLAHSYWCTEPGLLFSSDSPEFTVYRASQLSLIKRSFQ